MAPIHVREDIAKIGADKGGAEDSVPDHLPLLLSADEAARLLGLHRKSVYREIQAGRLRAVRYGRRVLIPREAVEEFASSLEAAK